MGVDDRETLNQPKSCPSMASCYRRVICPLPHLSFLIQRNLLLAGLGPGDPIFQWKFVKVCISSGGVWESCIVLRLYRERGCYSPLFQCPQPHLSVFVDAKETNPMKLGQLGQQYAKQWGCVDEEVSSIIFGVEAGQEVSGERRNRLNDSLLRRKD